MVQLVSLEQNRGHREWTRARARSLTHTGGVWSTSVPLGVGRSLVAYLRVSLFPLATTVYIHPIAGSIGLCIHLVVFFILELIHLPVTLLLSLGVCATACRSQVRVFPHLGAITLPVQCCALALPCCTPFMSPLLYIPNAHLVCRKGARAARFHFLHLLHQNSVTSADQLGDAGAALFYCHESPNSSRLAE